MRVEPTQRAISHLLAQIGAGEIRLPEIQRDYVWKPPQVAKLIDSLYRGYPTGYLLFWRVPPRTEAREFDIDDGVGPPMMAPPLYLLDGQQRLTSLYRVFNDHPEAQVVFNVESEKFQNQSAATRQDRRWVKVYDIVTAEALSDLVYSLRDAVPELRAGEIERRLSRVKAILEREYRFDILEDFTDEDVADIFVRVNSHGRSLRATDLALATLSARWPGILAKMQAEADPLAEMDYPDLDVGFLTRTLAAVVLGRGLSAWSYGQLARATDDELESGWRVVTRGVGHLVPLLKNNLRVPHSGLFPSIIVLVPAVVFLGSRPNEPLDAETRSGLLYWLLAATMLNRYSGSTDTRLGQDIPAARRPGDAVYMLLRNLGVLGTHVAVTDQALVARGRGSPYFFLSYLATRRRGATDWWYGTEIVPGGAGMQALEGHHVHPQATLKGSYSKQEINDLANLVFISKMANDKIGSRSPRDYFPELGDDELRGHLVPLDPALRTASAYPAFLAGRRRLLAEAMTEVLDSYRPAWLAEAERPVEESEDPLAGATLAFDMFASEWETERKLLVRAAVGGGTWQAVLSAGELEAALAEVENGTPSNLTVAGENVTVTAEGERVEAPVGPFRVYGSLLEWRRVLARETAEARALSECPDAPATPWAGELAEFPITSSE